MFILQCFSPFFDKLHLNFSTMSSLSLTCLPTLHQICTFVSRFGIIQQLPPMKGVYHVYLTSLA